MRRESGSKSRIEWGERLLVVLELPADTSDDHSFHGFAEVGRE